jgi:Fe-S-cluster-containing dehydrogenase component
MMKCDMCYDRTSVGKRPMCATVCPSEALFFGPAEVWEQRRRGRLVNSWKFGRQTVKTGVYMVMPECEAEPEPAITIDVRLNSIGTMKRKEGIR